MDHNKKNIDRLFQEKFKDFEVAPNDAVWNRINESLPQKKKKRRVIALWWQIGGVAAVIALLLTVGVSVFNTNEPTKLNLPVVNTDESNPNRKQIEKPIEAPKNSKQQNLNSATDDGNKFVNSDAQVPSRLESQKRISDPTKKNFNSLTTIGKSVQHTVANNANTKKEASTSQVNNPLNTSTAKDNSNTVAENSENSNRTSKPTEVTKLTSESELKSILKNKSETQVTTTAANSTQNKDIENSKLLKPESGVRAENALDPVFEEVSPKQSIQDAIAEQNEIIDEEEKEDEKNRWSIAPNVAPVYYSSLGQGSSLDQQFKENAKSNDINMSYGITGAYAVSKKLKIRAGINRVNLNQSTTNVFAFTGPEIASRTAQQAQPLENITFKGEQNILLMSSEMLGISSAPEVFSTKTAGDLEQRFGFIEVPMELEYQLVDKKFGVNIIGGFSTFFLNENEIYADIGGNSTLIGEANNINDTSFSANFGLGFDYSLSNQWNINLEPQFKYQINTFNNTAGDFRPFFIGVYTGLSFKF